MMFETLPDLHCSTILENLKKIGYPNNDDSYQHVPRPYDLVKWTQTVKELYALKRDGAEQASALHQLTSSWSEEERYDFSHWLRFYQTGSHMKYAAAQSWYQGNGLGYFIPTQKEEPKSFEEAKDQGENELTSYEKAEIAQEMRKKILARLTSVEKLILSERGEIMAGDEHDKLLDSVYTLKKQITSLKRKATESIEMILKEAEDLQVLGFYKAASFLLIAADPSTEPPNVSAAPVIPPTNPPSGQTPENSNIPTAPMPGVSAPSSTPAPTTPPPNQGSGDAVNFPSTNIPGNSPSSNPINPSPGKNDKPDSGLDLFVENIATNGITDSDEADDELFVSDSEDSLEVDDELYVDENTDFEYSKDDLVAKGQVAPPPAPMVPKQNIEPKPEDKNPTVDVGEETHNPAIEGKDFDSIIDAAFSTITVADVVKRLESIANVYRTRELSRQLSIIDLMLDRLGVAPMLSSMTEVINRSLDSSQYILTRLEDILGKLRGTLPTPELDLDSPSNGAAANTPEAQALQAKLQKDLQKDEQKKQLRKDMEERATEQAIVGDETPNVSLDDAPSAPVASAPKPAPVPHPV